MLKRFIRYLYEYENGRRMRNVGFVKVDQSDGECIVHIHGKGLRLEGEKELTIYLFYEKEKECIGLPQGTVENVNPAVNYQLRYTKEDVGEPGNYDRIEGIIMENSSHRKYAAVWDDMPVNVNEMRLWTPADLTEGSGEEERVEERPETEEPAEGRMSELRHSGKRRKKKCPQGMRRKKRVKTFPRRKRSLQRWKPLKRKKTQNTPVLRNQSVKNQRMKNQRLRKNPSELNRWRQWKRRR